MIEDNYIVFGLYKNRPDVDSALENLEDAGFDSETIFKIVVHNGYVLVSVHAFGNDESLLAADILETTGAQPISKIQKGPKAFKILENKNQDSELKTH